MSTPKVATDPTPETTRDMVRRWLRENPDKPRFALTRQMLESLTAEPVPCCDACGWPNLPDGCCSRQGCCNSD